MDSFELRRFEKPSQRNRLQGGGRCTCSHVQVQGLTAEPGSEAPGTHGNRVASKQLLGHGH